MMKYLNKILSAPFFLIAVVGVALCVISMIISGTEMNDMYHPAMMINYVLFFTGVGATFLGTIVMLVQDLKAGMIAVGSLVILLIVLGVGYVLSGGVTTDMNMNSDVALTVGNLKVISAGIYMLYICVAVGAITAVACSLKAVFEGN